MAFAGLIAGLGNPGSKYSETRHNFGFMLIDALIEGGSAFSDGAQLLKDKDEYALWSWMPPECSGTDVAGKKGGVGGAAIAGSREKWLLLKPLSYMNLSGVPVRRICSVNGISPERLLVVHDELDLPLGRARFKNGGGTAGHRGLNSIVEQVGTRDYPRLRLGIGRPDYSGQDISNYVLSKFTKEEKVIVKDIIRAGAMGVCIFCNSGITAAANYLHSRNFHPESVNRKEASIVRA